MHQLLGNLRTNVDENAWLQRPEDETESMNTTQSEWFSDYSDSNDGAQNQCAYSRYEVVRERDTCQNAYCCGKNGRSNRLESSHIKNGVRKVYRDVLFIFGYKFCTFVHDVI